jgi:hypothetical protein
MVGRIPQCCAPQLPRQFGEGEHIVFAGDTVPKTLALFLQQSTKPQYFMGVGASTWDVVC